MELLISSFYVNIQMPHWYCWATMQAYHTSISRVMVFATLITQIKTSLGYGNYSHGVWRQLNLSKWRSMLGQENAWWTMITKLCYKITNHWWYYSHIWGLYGSCRPYTGPISHVKRQRILGGWEQMDNTILSLYFQKYSI